MRWWNFARPVLIAAAVGALLAPFIALLFIKLGIFDVAAAKRHTKFTQWMTEETMKHSIRRHAAGIEPPPWTSAAQLVAGYCAYETRCVACHGAAAVARQQWVSGMEPQPPYLLDATERFTPGELFWIVKNGIKMTGMPAWGQSMSDHEIWNVVAWLEASRRLAPQTYLRWRAEGRCRAMPGGSPVPAPPAIPLP